MAKSFFEKLGNSLNLEDEQNDIDATDESFEDGVVGEIPAELQDDFNDDLVGDNKKQGKKSITTLAVASTKSNITKEKTQTKNARSAAVKTAMPKKSLHITAQKITQDTTSSATQELEEGQLTIDVYEKNDEIVVQSTIAGVDAKDLDIDITADSITIRGKRTQEEEVREDDYYYQELYWGAFSRSVLLPTEINPDKATAALKNGVLTIRLPKLTKSQQKKLKVSLE